MCKTCETETTVYLPYPKLSQVKAGLKIAINQGTMSGQNGNVTAQKLHSTVILTGLAYSHS